METSLIDIKNNYAQEQGYEDWNEIRKEFREKVVTFVEMTGHENAVIIRAQKAALEKAAENAKTTTAFASRITERIIVDRTSITNPENLIR